MGATLIMVVSLAIVLALIVVLLAKLYCFCLTPLAVSAPIITNTATGAPTPTNTASSFPPLDNQTQSTSPLSSFYAQGVIHAPRNFLFPAPPHQFGILSLVSPSTSLATSPNPVQEISTRIGTGTTTNCKEKLTVLFLVMVNDVGCSIGLGNNGSSGDDEKAEPWMTSSSPMKNLPAQACPVSLRDARSLCNNGLSSSSSSSPCTSPSW
ncbi:hypothetical protein GOBAR_DD31024 [Gossypium barbadense]|nr:hypothetical protein GOBAR_DD31024 [Gossypium barbadense]